MTGHYCANCGNDWSGAHACADLPLSNVVLARPLTELELPGPTPMEMIEEMVNARVGSGANPITINTHRTEGYYAQWTVYAEDGRNIEGYREIMVDGGRTLSARADSPKSAIRALYEKWKER